MLRFLVAAPVVLGSALVAGALIGLVFQEPLRRTTKSIMKTAMRGAQTIGDGYQALKEEVEDARAEEAFEHRSSGAQLPKGSVTLN